LHVLATTEAAVLQAAAIVQLFREGYVKPLRPSKRAAHIFAHQLMFLAVQESGLPRGDWNRRVDGSAAFSGLRGIALGSIVG
jgi:ATP-dependent Lhr-like helicase